MMKNEKEIKKQIAMALSTRPMYVEIITLSEHSAENYTVRVKYQGFPYRVEIVGGSVDKMYRELGA